MNACLSDFRVVNPTLRTFSAAEARIAQSSIRFNNLSAAELGYPENVRLLISSEGTTLATEQWLDTIESRLHYERWYCGHYHTDKEIDKIRFMFQDYTMLPHQISLSAEKEMIRRMQRQAEIVEALGLMDEAQEEK